MPKANKNDVKGSWIGYFSNLVKTYGGINMAQGIPGFQPPEKLLDIVSEIRNDNIHQYAPGTGNLELLDVLRNRYASRYNNDSAQFFVLNGATEAISLVYTMLYHKLGKSLKCLALSPAYESYIYLPTIFHNEVVTLKLEEDTALMPPLIEKVVVEEKLKLLFLSTPGNPWGSVFSAKTLSEIMALCKKHQCYVIIDAVYSELWFGKTPPEYPLGSLNEYVFYVNSFSKLLSVTGWRLGYLLTHNSHFSDLKYIHDYIGLSSSAPLQVALARFSKIPGEIEKYATQIRNIINGNFQKFSSSVEEAGFYVPPHEGGYFIWCRCPEHITSGVDFSIELYNRHKTAVIPGIHFGKEWVRWIRINIAQPEKILNTGFKNLISLAMDNNIGD